MTAPNPATIATDREIQREVADFFGAMPDVKRIDTHGAMVFLTGADAYKIKRAVRFAYMDFSTLARREAACRNEIAVNQANAPGIYHGVVALTREADGALALDGEGEPVEWAVHMARFDETRGLDRLADDGKLSNALLSELARQIAAAHARAPERPKADPVTTFETILTDNAADFAAMAQIFGAREAQRLDRLSRDKLKACADLMRARADAGLVRHCHGDLHLKNIVEADGHPLLFDAIEFDDAIATIDVLYDLAFLLMDLLTRDLAQAANLVFNEYLKAARDDAHFKGLAAMPLYLSLRAAIRAKVTASALKHKSGDERQRDTEAAKRYFAAALAYLETPPARLAAIGGLSGTGKTTIARAIAAHVGPAPGAVHVRSDVERKLLFGVGETEKLPEEAYRSAVSRQVYERLMTRARTVLEAGHGVVVDAVHARPEERAQIEALAREMGVAFQGIWLETDSDLMRRRVEARRGDASDATAAVVERQLDYDLGNIGWARVDAGRASPDVARDVLALVGKDRLGTG